MRKYQEFLRSKRLWAKSRGLSIHEDEINPQLYSFQRAVTSWALRNGRAAVFGDCGLGKTPIQLEWARHIRDHTEGSVLILAPLAVSEQTVREGEKFGVEVTAVRDGEEVGDHGIYITNYEMLSHFQPEQFEGIVLDESSILKSFQGKVRRQITDFAESLEYRLCCTATPAPNDHVELANHAEFLGVMSGKEMLALFFRQDGNTTNQWRLKGHAEEDFWKWVASWAVAFRTPEDLGFEEEGFDLPPLTFHEHEVDAGALGGYLFPVEVKGMAERRQARRESLEERVEVAADLVAREPDEQWLVWCDLNAESEALAEAIPGAVEVQGSHPKTHKTESMLGFAEGDVQTLVSKPSICGHGMNFQRCSRMIFVGLSDSYEQLYQATRRCWRFGQDEPVEAHIVISSAEGSVRKNIERKERQADKMFDELVSHLRLYQLDEKLAKEESVARNTETGDGWKMMLGDCVERIQEVEDESVGLSVFSPPFPGMYAYTDSPRDVGNVRDSEELIDHFSFLMPELLRATMPGRNCCIHLTQEPVFKYQAGHVGMKDFRGEVIRRMEDSGWIYFGEVTIDKDPQIKAARTKEHTLLFKTLSTDSAQCRMAMADYMLIFKKPGDNPAPVPSGTHEKYNPGKGWITPEEWIEWAAPVWYRASEHYPGGIRETDVLDVTEGREEKDEKHLCPLQLGVIERAVKLWSKPGDLVLSPFAGIGSEGYVAVKEERLFVGIELKESYYRAAVRNLERAENAMSQSRLFELAAP